MMMAETKPEEKCKPLHRQAGGLSRPAKDFHRGLWWERFFDRYPENFSAPTVGKKAAFVRDLVPPESCGELKQLEAATQRMRLMLQACAGDALICQVDWRFATGLGQEHPTENGCAWHRTLGVPYLPGASVKGLLRGWMEWEGGVAADKAAPPELAERLTHWFGSPHKDPELWPKTLFPVGEESEMKTASPTEKNKNFPAGWYVFFDALPIKPVGLAAEVMTPHYGDWYEKGRAIETDPNTGEPDPSSVPADWHSPNPIVFLSVKQASFQFGVGIRANLPPEQRKQAVAELGEVLEKLKEALAWAGAGAKTAAGYGRLSVNEEAQKSWEQERRERETAQALAEAQAQADAAKAAETASLPPLERKLIDTLAGWKDKALPDWQKLHQSLFATEIWQGEERAQIAQRVRAMMQEAGVWVPEENSKKGARARQVQGILEKP
jgi:CRISPR-associated protein Cmr6